MNRKTISKSEGFAVISEQPGCYFAGIKIPLKLKSKKSGIELLDFTPEQKLFLPRYETARMKRVWNRYVEGGCVSPEPI